jgi:hypothetical protein
MNIYKIWAHEAWGSPYRLVCAYITAASEFEAKAYFEARCGLKQPRIHARKLRVGGMP